MSEDTKSEEVTEEQELPDTDPLQEEIASKTAEFYQTIAKAVPLPNPATSVNVLRKMDLHYREDGAFEWKPTFVIQ